MIGPAEKRPRGTDIDDQSSDASKLMARFKPLMALWRAMSELYDVEVTSEILHDPRCGMDIRTKNPSQLGALKHGPVHFSHGVTPLLMSIIAGRTDIMYAVLDAHADPTIPDTKLGFTPLHATVLSEDEAAFDAILSLPGVAIDAVDREGCTPLMIAARFGRMGPLRTLIARGANVMAASLKGLTALHLATQSLHIDAMNLLISHGAHIEATTVEGLTPLHCAFSQSGGQPVAARLLISKGANIHATTLQSAKSCQETILHVAVHQNRLEDVRLLVEQGADIESTDSLGTTPLMTAASKGHHGIVAFLLTKGANPNTFNGKEHTALSLMVSSTSSNCTRESLGTLINGGANLSLVGSTTGRGLIHKAILSNAPPAHVLVALSLGANVNVADKKGITAFGCIINREMLDMPLTMTFIRYGADINTRAADGSTVMHRLAMSGLAGEAKRLIRRGAAVDLARKNGNTPLHDAAQCGVSEVLLWNGADVNALNKVRQTPMHLCAASNRRTMGLFRANGADLTALCDGGLTPLDYFNQVTANDIQYFGSECWADTRDLLIPARMPN